jgi:hypothetical protein
MRLMLLVKTPKAGSDKNYRSISLELTKEQLKKISPRKLEIHNPNLHYFYFIEEERI